MIPILIDVVEYFSRFLQLAIFARAISSWLPISRDNPIVRLLYVVTEPVVGPVRALIRKSPLGGPGMMIDFSPLIAYFLIMILSSVLVGFLRTLIA